MSKYIKLNKTKLGFMMIKKFKDSLTDLKTILDKIDKIKIIKRLETNQIEETTNRELKELEIKKIDELEKFYAKLGFRLKSF